MNEQYTDKLLHEKFYSKIHKLILNYNSRNANWIVSDPFTLVQSAENMVKFNKEIQIETHSVVFQFTPMSKCTKPLRNLYNIKVLF